MADAMLDARMVSTPVGEARISWHRPVGPAKAVLGLGHGAGGGIEAPDLVALAAALPAHGVAVGLVEQPWRVAGKKIGPAPKTLDLAWLPIAEQLAAEGLPLVVGGRSAGARVACRTGAASGAVAVLALAFPLHPPGRPERSRAEELLGTGLPTLVVQGGADPFGAPAEFPALPPGHRLVEVPRGGHGFAVPKSAPLGRAEVLELITTAVAGWLAETVLS
ncbi:putative alpha/beta-hydrolase family hydrolase [Kitasatospora sp. MAP12-15]|uniref:alpha/beta hydrolase family protein n=1 Tax=unclassified Kitasatospora TaxID=2633591 RepID=UPI0024739040|nr:alpha/beta family hydrolase [Kitasatospora sp. MAP12-44]MDH6112721.1 putative alpha/beta-hydrolase family hydrolase [Kitasatospora sp. MAP12-44]